MAAMSPTQEGFVAYKLLGGRQSDVTTSFKHPGFPGESPPKLGVLVSDKGPVLRAGLSRVQVYALIFQRSPQALDHDVVEATPLAVHRDPRADPLQPVRPGEGRELRALVDVHDLRRAEVVDRLVQCLDPEVTSSGLEMRQASTLRVNHSMMATR